MELRVGAARATVLPGQGGRLASLNIDGCEVLGAGIVGGGAPESWFSGCFPMAPFAGRLTGDRVVWGEGAVTLPRPAPQVEAAHGVVDAAAWTVREATPERVFLRTELVAPWPFGGWAEQRISLRDDAIELVLRCGNDEREMPVSLGYHPWFRREVGGAAAELRFAPEARFAEIGPGLFAQPGAGADAGPGDGARDHSYLHAGDPVIAWGDLELTLRSSHEVWHVFDGQRPAFCVEPLTAAPDGLQPERTWVVGPGVVAELRFELSWAQRRAAARDVAIAMG